MLHRIWKPTLATAIGLCASWALRRVEARALPTQPDVQLVITAGEDSFVRLDADADVATGTFRMTDKLTAVAAVRDRDVPPGVRAWRGKELIVDGTCRAKVTGFAVVARVDGWPDYAGVKRWTAAAIAEHGSRALVGRLSACTGTWARAATLPPIRTATAQPADPLLDFRARADLFATAFATELQAEWAKASVPGDWRIEVPITTQIVRAPDGLRYVIVHARNGGTCGDFGVNVLAVYRENTDGTLQRVSLHHGDLNSVDAVLEIGGYLYLSGTAGLTDYRVIEDLDGENQVSDYIPFVGCPC